MIRKVVLSPQECGQLVPHGFKLYEPKINRLSKLSLKKSRFDDSKQVIATPPIIVVDEERYFANGLLVERGRYVVNGKHRASIAYARGYFLDACVIRTSKDLRYHTPREAFGDLRLEEVLKSFDYRYKYVWQSQMLGINTVADLARRYLH